MSALSAEHVTPRPLPRKASTPVIKISKSRAGTQRVTFSLTVGAPPERVSDVGSLNDWTTGGRHP